MTPEQKKIVTRARAILREDTEAPIPAKSARQGDLTLRPLSGHVAEPQSVQGAVILAEGRHGSHVALGELGFDAAGNILHVGTKGCVVVHTDELSARHKAIALSAGCYQVGALRELNAVTLLPEKVQD